MSPGRIHDPQLRGFMDAAGPTLTAEQLDKVRAKLATVHAYQFTLTQPAPVTIKPSDLLPGPYIVPETQPWPVYPAPYWHTITSDKTGDL